MERHLKIIGHLFFLVFLIFSIVFSHERVLFTDSAYQFFKIVNFEEFNIEASRFPAVLTQAFTLLAIKLHVPLKWVMVCFSASFVVLYYIVFLLSVYVFRNIAAGIAIALVLCLSVRHGYFHIVTETHQALIYSCLFFAWMMAQKGKGFSVNWKQIPNLIIGVIIIFLAGYSHPVAYLAIVFSIVYFAIDSDNLKSNLAYSMLIITVVLGAFKYFTTPSGSYEGQFLSQILQADKLLMRYSSLYSKWFYDHLYKEVYRLPFWMVIAVSSYYLLNSKFLKFLFVPAFYFGFILFAKVVFNAEDARIMMERAFMPVAFFASIPFLNDFILGNVKFKTAKTVLVILLLVFSLTGIYKTSRYFSDRIRYMDQFFAHMNDKGTPKLLIDWKYTTNNLVYVSWAFGVETLLYSSSKTGEAKTVFVYDKINELNFPADDKNLFLCVHFDPIWNSSQLNRKYFHLSPETYLIEKDSILFSNVSAN